MKKSAIVIGGGFGGMAAAIRAKALGYEVTLLDRGAMLGGKACVYEREGFRHDAGPTVITAPFLLEELFSLLGENFNDHVKLVPLNPWYRFYFRDGSTFNYGCTVEDTLNEIRKFDERDVAGYQSLLSHSERLYDVGFTRLAAKPFHKIGMMLKQIPDLIRLRGDKTVWKLVSEHLRSDHLRRAFSIHPLLVGGNPFDTTSIYSLIHFLERKWGIYFAMGGTGAIVAAFDALMSRHGIQVRLRTDVKKLLISEGKVTGVELSTGENLHADVTIANTDAPYLYNHLIDPHSSSWTERLKVRSAHYSMGLFVLYFGTKKTYDDLAHHTIWMGDRFEGLLDDIFNKRILPKDFSLYIHRPTATDPSFAPPDCDSFYVLCPVPNLKSQIDWAIEGPALRDRIVEALDQTIMPGLSDYITADFFKTPEDFRQSHLSLHGAAFSIAPIFTQSAWFRFHNKADGIQNLFLVGAGCHPGAGLPGVLCSAKTLDHFLGNQAISH